MQRILYIAAPGNLQLLDDIQGRGAEHLVFLVAQGLGRRHDYGISRVHTDRVNIFHIADGDPVPLAVPHHFILDLFPARYTSLHKDFMHAGEPETVQKYLPQFFAVMCDSAAGATQCISRPQNDRIPDLFRKSLPVLHGRDDFGRGNRFPDLLHGVLEGLAVLRLTNRQCRRPDQADIMRLKIPAVSQLHGKIESGLTAKCREDRIGMLRFDNLFYDFRRKRLDIDLIGDIPVRHDGRRVAVKEYDLNSLFLQCAAGLCARIVEFGSLSYDNRAGADHKHFSDVLILRHAPLLSSYP